MTGQPVRDTQAMISGMAPELDPTIYHFCVTQDAGLMAEALAVMHEAEGISLILSDARARVHGLQTEMPMCRITLTVHSALDGVGLTAAVAHALAEAGIACNMVAGYHHDHVFVPEPDARRAMDVLRALAEGARQ